MLSKAKILIIEDDADIREGVHILLESEGYTIIEAENGRQGLEQLDETVDLVILDVMMPGMSGIETCREIRKDSYVPILFLTAKSSESDKLLGLTAGGDDYLCKPFSYAELLGRVRAMLRRYQEYNGGHFAKPVVSEFLEHFGIRVNTKINEVWVNGEEKKLTDLEYKLLRLFMQYPNKIFSAQNLYESVWNEPYMYSSNGTVMVHIRKLRMKLEETPETPQHIKTVWGKGYRFEE